jgi:hypothetical protein
MTLLDRMLLRVPLCPYALDNDGSGDTVDDGADDVFMSGRHRGLICIILHLLLCTSVAPCTSTQLPVGTFNALTSRIAACVRGAVCRRQCWSRQ